MPARTAGIAIGVCTYQLSFFAAVKLTGVAVGTVVAIGTGPAAAGVLGRLVNGERLTRRWAFATLAAAGGVALLAGDGGGTVDPGGIALAATAGAGYATCTVLSKRLIVNGAAPEGVMAAGVRWRRGAARSRPARRRPRLPDERRRPWPRALPRATPTAVAYVLFSRGLRGL